MERISRAIGANHPKDAARYIGNTVMLQDGFIQVSFMIITIIANQRGLTDAAAVGIVEKIISFLFLVPSSLLSTVSAPGAYLASRFFPQTLLPMGLASAGGSLFSSVVCVGFYLWLRHRRNMPESASRN